MAVHDELEQFDPSVDGSYDTACGGTRSAGFPPLQRPSRPMSEAAQQHYASGTRFFEEDQWDAALVEFIASLNPTT